MAHPYDGLQGHDPALKEAIDAGPKPKVHHDAAPKAKAAKKASPKKAAKKVAPKHVPSSVLSATETITVGASNPFGESH